MVAVWCVCGILFFLWMEPLSYSFKFGICGGRAGVKCEDEEESGRSDQESRIYSRLRPRPFTSQKNTVRFRPQRHLHNHCHASWSRRPCSMHARQKASTEPVTVPETATGAKAFYSIATESAERIHKIMASVTSKSCLPKHSVVPKDRQAR